MKRNNLVGEIFGKLTVLEKDIVKSGKTYYKCLCECGNIKSIRGSSLTAGDTKSCNSGACKGQLIDITGKRFGKLTAIKYHSKGYFVFECDCGNKTITRSIDVRNGKSLSCGKCINTKYVKSDCKTYMIGKTNNGFEFMIDIDDYEKYNNHNFYYSDEYIKCKINGIHIKLHRLIMKPQKNMVVDHINGDTFDNRKCNLRICTNQQNSFNSKPRKNIYKGINRLPSGNFRAVIMKDGLKYQLGTYNTEEEAAKAYNKKAKELFGEYAKLNNIKEQMD